MKLLWEEKKTAEYYHIVAVGWSNPLSRYKDRSVSSSEREAQAELCKSLTPRLTTLYGHHKERRFLTAIGAEKGKQQGWEKQDLLYKRRPNPWIV